MTPQRSPLLPDRYPQQDLFVCDIVDAAPKGDMGSMEHPIFSLATKPDMKPREYKNGDTFIKVSPSSKGLATVHDRDVLIYCISQCIAAMNAGRKVDRKDRKMSFKAYELLRSTNRQTSGRGYELLKDTLRRLQGTQIETNITQGGSEHFSVFGLVDKAEIKSETRDGRMQDVEITLSDWVFDAIENNHVLTLNRKYFQLRKPVERRLYEIARKHCGNQPKWEIRLDRLKSKCGSVSSMKEFKRMVQSVIAVDFKENHLPDYKFELSDDIICVRPKASRKLDGQMLQPLQSDTYEAAREYAAGWDVRQLESEWREWVQSKRISVSNSDAHFLKFCKKRGPYR
jgi:plasmid replication initiation protein